MQYKEDHMSRSAVRVLLSLSLLAALVASSIVPMSGSLYPLSLAASPESTQRQESSEDEAPSTVPAPLMFIQNAGQYPDNLLFQVWGGGHSAWLAEDGLWLSVATATSDAANAKPTQRLDLNLSFVGAAAKPIIEPFGRMDAHVSYYIGNDPTKWQADVPVWTGVRYKGLYPGIDLEMSGAEGQWTWQVVAQAGGNLSAMRLRVQGAQKVSLQGNALRLSTQLGDLMLPLIGAAQSGGFSAAGKLPAATVVGNDIIAPLVTTQQSARLSGASDLLETWLIGGSGGEDGRDMALWGQDAYYTGGTTSTDWPAQWGQVFHGGDDIYVMRCSTRACRASYLAFLGGSAFDQGWYIGLDASGSAYVTGETLSTNFPVTANSFDTTCGTDGTCNFGKADAYMVKLDGSGHLAYASYLGGEAREIGAGIAVSPSGEVYITGWTESNEFPTSTTAFDRVCGTAMRPCGPGPDSAHHSSDAYVTKLTPRGTGPLDLVYSTFVGGGYLDDGQAIALRGNNAYISGRTISNDFPVTGGAYDTACGSSGNCSSSNWQYDAFVLELDASGASLIYSTFLGGGQYESTSSLNLDAAGNAYVVGHTASADFPTTPAAFDTTCGVYGAWCVPSPPWPPYNLDGFVTKLNPSGSALVYSTFAGGEGFDQVNDVAVDASGSAYVSGITWSTDFPTTGDAFDQTRGADGADAFVLKFNSTGTALLYGTYLGGTEHENGGGIAVGAANQIYLTGETESTDFPTAMQGGGTMSGGSQAFVVKLTTGYAINLNAGGPAYVDDQGRKWQADQEYAVGSWGYVGATSSTMTQYKYIWGDPNITLYQSQRAGMSGYAFSVPDGTYTVTLKFAEIAYDGANQRVFDVKIEGTTVLSNFDIFAQAGNKQYTSVDRSFTASVADGLLQIKFVAVIGIPRVSAIKIERRED
jgi:hypothetical protein